MPISQSTRTISIKNLHCIYKQSLQLITAIISYETISYVHFTLPTLTLIYRYYFVLMNSPNKNKNISNQNRKIRFSCHFCLTTNFCFRFIGLVYLRCFFLGFFFLGGLRLFLLFGTWSSGALGSWKIFSRGFFVFFF